MSDTRLLMESLHVMFDRVAISEDDRHFYLDQIRDAIDEAKWTWQLAAVIACAGGFVLGVIVGRIVR